ncbi:M23 family metallopeptidase [Mycobacterium sp.]|uniref:M23 family metallopeptidase n=1 Tax=Mycobacterium sp. TaxID=1785 RepID=UPI003BAC9A83
MPQHRFARSSSSAAARPTLDGWPQARREENEVTEILPLDDFDNFDDLDYSDFGEGLNFDDEARLPSPAELRARAKSASGAPRWRDDATEVIGSATTESRAAHRRGGQHRKQPTSAVRGRVLVSAMAAGAAAAAAHAATSGTDTHGIDTVLTAQSSTLIGESSTHTPRGAQVIAAQPAANVAVHNAEFARGMAFAEERAQREARLQQPLYVMPTKGIFTSNFGYRWGALHAGIDIANSMGTPIRAVSDGLVIAAGPTAGYGMWVKLRHADGTVTLYGHINSALVDVGERVMAGDQIATMGNRGFSTGPHLHFEVLLGGTKRIDPVPWLAKRGLEVGDYCG